MEAPNRALPVEMSLTLSRGVISWVMVKNGDCILLKGIHKLGGFLKCCLGLKAVIFF